ncbi:hypothetical protein [Halobellus sp. GM3]|uniref:hypothetical protein n=1 Tax=Halobellus sp. GM3 TaxID=3458410 RepID=UPI00403E1B0F
MRDAPTPSVRVVRRLRRVGGAVSVTVVAGVLLVAVAAGALLAGAVAASDLTATTALVEDVQRSVTIASGVDTALSRTNVLRGVGALVGLALGIAVGSFATYRRRRH